MKRIHKTMKMQCSRYQIIALSVLSPFCGFAAAAEGSATAPAAATPVCGQEAARGVNPPVELGKVGWGRDFDAAVAESKKTGKPLIVLFDEVPGCGGCQTYGKVLLSHPLVVEAGETLFVPVFIRNNDPDKNSADNKLLKRFDEKSWNYPVVRFTDMTGPANMESAIR